MPEEQLGPEKFTASAPIAKPPAPPPGAIIRVAGVGKAVNDAPEANRRQAVRAHCGHDLWGKRMLDASQQRCAGLRRN